MTDLEALAQAIAKSGGFADDATDILAALDAAGYQIVPKARCALCGSTRIDGYGHCLDCPEPK